MLTCRDKSLYTGATTDVERRLSEHSSGSGAKYTRSRLPVELTWSSGLMTRSEALREEARVKRLSRAEKLEFLEQRSGGS